MKLPQCPVCKTSRWAKRIRGDFFSCTNCGSMWEVKGYTQKERAESFCPMCNTYVEYANWQPFTYRYGFSKVMNLHYECHDKHLADIAEDEARVDAEIAKLEYISSLPCPNCNEKFIVTYPDGEDIVYICDNCNAEIDEEWISEQGGVNDNS